MAGPIPTGPSSFEMTQRMGGGGHGGGKGIGTLKVLIGTNLEDKATVNFDLDGKAFHVTGWEGMEPGILAMLFKARGQGFFAFIFDAFASREEAFGAGQGEGAMLASTSSESSSGGSSGSSSGSNRPFSSMPPMDMMGPISDVHPSMLGRLTPSPTPGAARGPREMAGGMGM